VAAGRGAGILQAMSDSALTDEEPTAAPEFRRIARAIEFVAANVRSQPSLAEIAAAAHWSEYHFAREFRRWTGISAKLWLQQLSLTAAQQSLAGQRSVLQAAIDAGLSGPGRLHDLFVTLEAVTPGEFKARGRGITLWHGQADSPFGTALIVRSTRGIAFLAFADEDGGFDGYDAFRATWSEATWERDDQGASRIAGMIWGSQPAADRRLTLWVHGSNFQLQVWRALLAAGWQRTLSYQELAQAIGRGSACRAVGSAVGTNPVAWLIPCHHVLRANGALGGYRWGLERKQAMLAWEFARSIRDASRRRPSASHASAGSR
jgi:AraC family transcriptional regulator, regulatory protein of adaptative response / methylated-DNA-[protein]-cysteine methyltransferase